QDGGRRQGGERRVAAPDLRGRARQGRRDAGGGPGRRGHPPRAGGGGDGAGQGRGPAAPGHRHAPSALTCYSWGVRGFLVAGFLTLGAPAFAAARLAIGPYVQDVRPAGLTIAFETDVPA